MWDTTARRYRNTRNGQWITPEKVTTLRNEFAASQRAWADQLASMLAGKHWTVARWETEVRTRLKTLYLGQYMLGRGGKHAMNATDYGRVGALLKEQYGFLRAFALDIQAGSMSQSQIAARTHLYHASSVHAFERGKTAAYSADLLLPAYPADGGTVCKANCRCRWRITETKKAWKAYWVRTKQESCRGCVDRARIYNPYVQMK